MKASDWIKVEDRLPEYNTQCLVKTNYGSYSVAIYIASVNKNKGCFKDEFGWLYCGVTHWMLIVPPKED